MSKSALIGGEQIAANNDSLCFADSGLNAASATLGMNYWLEDIT